MANPDTLLKHELGGKTGVGREGEASVIFVLCRPLLEAHIYWVAYPFSRPALNLL
jgi:hypothetical protein